MTPEPGPYNTQRVEAFLDQLLVPLGRKLSGFHCGELRRELRTHLWGRIDAYRELGQSETDAVTEALQQFGDAEDFTRQRRREWTKAPAVSASALRLWEAGKSALKPSLGGIAAAFLPFFAINLFYRTFQHSPAGAALLHYGDVLYWSWIGLAFLLLPALVGARQGRRQPKYAGVGMAAALVSGIAAVSLLYAVVDGTTSDDLYAGSLCSVLLMLMVIWLPVAGGAAALTSWWVQRRKRGIA